MEFILDLYSSKKYASLTIASGALIPTKMVTKKDPTPYNHEDIMMKQIAIRPIPDSVIAHLTHQIKDHK